MLVDPACQRVFQGKRLRFHCMRAPGLGVELVPTKGSQRVRSMSDGSSPDLSNFEQAISLEGTLTGGVHL